MLYHADVIIEIPTRNVRLFKWGGGKDAININQDGEILG
jgi:hypothetical protein